MKTIYISLFVVIALLCGCSGGGPAHQPTEKYFLITANAKIPYWQEAGAGLAQAAKELGVQAEMLGPDAYSAEAEVQEFRNAVGKKPAGILVSAGNPATMGPAIDAAIAAGIPVVTIDADAPQSKRVFFVGTNNYQAGLTGGRLLVKLLKGRGNVVIFTIKAQENLADRLKGYQSAFEAAPGIKVVEVVDMEGNPSLTFDKVKEIVEKKQPVDAFVSLESLSGAEIAEVLDRNKVDGKVVVAMDTAPATLSWIEKGRIAATIGQKPYTMAYWGLKELAEVALRKTPALGGNFVSDPRAPVPMFIDTGTFLVDKDNVASVKR